MGTNQSSSKESSKESSSMVSSNDNMAVVVSNGMNDIDIGHANEILGITPDDTHTALRDTLMRAATAPYYDWPRVLVDLIISYVIPSHYVVLFLNGHLTRQLTSPDAIDDIDNDSMLPLPTSTAVYAALLPLTADTRWISLPSLPERRLMTARGVIHGHLYIAGGYPLSTSCHVHMVSLTDHNTMNREWRLVSTLPRVYDEQCESNTCMLADGRWIFTHKSYSVGGPAKKKK